jgi:hypothetical protein
VNKTQKVKEHLQSGRGITSIEAFELYGATRLSAIIFNLRKYGMNIVNVDRECTDRYGNKCSFVEYRLSEVK